MQILSVCASFASLVLSSVKLYYAQRLGIFMEVDPTLKMIIFAAPAITIQLLFPLFSLTLMASYFRAYVIVCIFVIMALVATSFGIAFIVLKIRRNVSHKEDMLNDMYKRGSQDLKKQGSQEYDNILITAILTSWIAPCTVWSNNSKEKSYFLLIISFMVIVGHSLGILSTYVYAHVGDLTNIKPPPIIRCNETIRYNLSIFECTKHLKVNLPT